MPDRIVLEQENQIRKLINNPQKHYKLRQDKALFYQLCSSLDIIEDTEDAIAAYTEEDFGQDKSLLYLAVYGLLQAIYVQQDAVINLCEALGIKDDIHNYPKLNEIREIRNDTAGHPTKRDRKKGKPNSYHHISHITLNKSGFTLASYFSDGSNAQFRDIKTSELIIEQRKFISSILTTLINGLEAEEKAHKEKFRMEKLIEIFPETLGYDFEKLFEGISRDEYAELANNNLKNIMDVVNKFRDSVKRRNMDFYERLQDDFELIEYAAANLGKYFHGRNGVENLAAQIYAYFLQNKVDALKEYAKIIDDEYAK
jgi:hypothetical protein